MYNDLIQKLRNTKSKSKRKMLDEAADALESSINADEIIAKIDKEMAEIPIQKSNFCPNCGAKMGDDEE